MMSLCSWFIEQWEELQEQYVMFSMYILNVAPCRIDYVGVKYVYFSTLCSVY